MSNGQTVVVAPVTYFSDNFENWTVHGGAWSSISGESVNHTINTSTDYARSGTKSLKVTDSDTTASYGVCLVKTFSPVITTDIYVRLYLFLRPDSIRRTRLASGESCESCAEPTGAKFRSVPTIR